MHTHTHIYIYLESGSKSKSMKMYADEKKSSLEDYFIHSLNYLPTLNVSGF